MSTEKVYNWWDTITGRPTIDKLTDEKAELEKKKKECEAKVTDLEASTAEQGLKIIGLEEHLAEMALEYTEQIQTIVELNAIIKESWKPLWIQAYIGDRREYNPWNESFHPISTVYFGDPKYYTLPYDAWMGFLPDISEEVQRMIKSKQHLLDCENYGRTMVVFVAMSFGKTRIKYEGAFIYMKSGEHAYNGFFAHDENGDRTLYVFEPQTGEVIGTEAEARDHPVHGERYNTYFIYF